MMKLSKRFAFKNADCVESWSNILVKLQEVATAIHNKFERDVVNLPTHLNNPLMQSCSQESAGHAEAPLINKVKEFQTAALPDVKSPNRNLDAIFKLEELAPLVDWMHARKHCGCAASQQPWCFAFGGA